MPGVMGRVGAKEEGRMTDEQRLKLRKYRIKYAMKRLEASILASADRLHPVVKMLPSFREELDRGPNPWNE